MNKVFFLICFSISALYTNAQLKTELPDMSKGNRGLLTDMIDTSTAMGRNMLSLYNKFSQIGFSGYIQPEYQYSESKGNSNQFQGGDWSTYSDNRFRLRRGRLRMDFTRYTPEGQPSVYFLLQFDGTERGVNIRDFWGRYYENKYKLFHFSVGMMARPFGYEVLYSSFYREAPERGRMSQTLMNTERDLGAMISLNPRKTDSKMKWFEVDLGVYNGQGMTGTTDYDGHKDLIMRVSSKRQKFKNKNIYYSGGISGYLGGITNQSAKIYKTMNVNGLSTMISDSSQSNIGKTLPRKYAGIDGQIVFPFANKKGQTEFRAEYIFGMQTATPSSSMTPGTLPVDASGNPTALTTRKFDGAYFYFLQNIVNWNNQLIIKYDWYDPNKKVKGKEISTANGFTAADVKYNTIGAGYLHYINDNMKLLFWYEKPINEHTNISGYTSTRKEGIATVRVQFSF